MSELPAIAAPVKPKVRPACWANVNRQGDVTHHSNSRMAWAQTPLYTQAQLDAEVAAERERCAKVCEEVATWAGSTWRKAGMDCAEWIRKEPNVEFSGVPAGHSSNHPAGGTSAGTQG